MAPARLATLMRTAGRGLADIVVPPVCLECRVRLDEVGVLCGACWRGVSFIRAPLCDRLGLPLPYGAGQGPLVSAAAVADPPVWARARAAAVYESHGIVARLVHGMKYADRLDCRQMMGRWLADAGVDLLTDADLLVPVPLTRWRLLRRRFNQAALLAREVSRLTGVPWDPLLLAKVRETRPQVTLSGSARRDNLRGAFAATARGRRLLPGRRIVLVDDVITTGATVEAATKALLAAGASRVDVLAVARVAAPPSAL